MSILTGDPVRRTPGGFSEGWGVRADIGLAHIQEHSVMYPVDLLKVCGDLIRGFR
jgi:hypothetical protein